MTEYIVRYENEYLQLLPDKMQELVRCNDCKHCSEEQYFNAHAIITCMKTGDFHDPEWFCAVGERRAVK